jgi:hypothetical protein
MSEDKSQPRSPARSRWWGFPLVGLIIIAIGVNIGATGKLYGRFSKAEMEMAPATAWAYGGVPHGARRGDRTVAPLLPT